MGDKQYLEIAVEQAKLSAETGGFPAGAILVKDEAIIPKGVSLGRILHDPTSHAETAAIREACRTLGSVSLEGATLYSSMEPCLMCFCGAYWADVSRIVYGCKRTKEIIEKGYYQGKTEIDVVNNENNRKIELVYVSSFEGGVFQIISDWEQKIGGS